MGESLLQMSSISFVRHMEFIDNFQLQRLLSRTLLLKGKIEHSKKLPGQCLMKQSCQMHIGKNNYTQLSIYLIDDNSECIRIILLMNYCMEDHPESNISEYLGAIATLKGTQMILESLILGPMKEYF